MTGEMRDDGHEPATKGDLHAVHGDMRVMRGDITDIRGDITDIRGDITGIRGDITGIRGDITDLRGAVAGMRDDILAAMREMLRPITLTLAHHTAELADIRGHIKDKMVTRDEFHSRMDGFAGRVADFDYSSAKNRSRLDEHERRIGALEEKRA